MNVLVVGGGGREHALTWKIAQSGIVERVLCAPGNPGMALHGQCVDVGVLDFDGLVACARRESVDLVVVGPEGPLAGGIVDRFEGEGIRVFGPSSRGAEIEASKTFAKEVMERYGIPTAEYGSFDDAEEAKAYVRERGGPIVVKADGLAAGKGVTVAATVGEALAAIDRIMVEGAFGEAGRRVVVEECLVGEEASIFALTDGVTVLPLASSQDHKALEDGDGGPNTGGMGAYSPAPIVTAAIFKEIEERVLRPCVEGLASEGRPYKGVLYAGLMITDEGPKVVEFNCRFGDPETQVVLPRMASDLVPLLVACCDGRLGEHGVEWVEGACVTVVMASGGYPGSYEKGKVIEGLGAAAELDDVIVFHAGTRFEGGEVLTNGGRVLNVTAVGRDIPETIELAYEGVGRIRFDGAVYRMDIGRKALARL